MIAEARQRLDKWLWFARVVKTRTLAAKLVAEGHVRINGNRQLTAAKPVCIGDVLTIALERDVRILKVLGPGVRRGPYEEARLLYDDLTTPADTVATSEQQGPASDPGSGRPTKKDRREMDKWRGDS